jgi:hypothetical protein
MLRRRLSARRPGALARRLHRAADALHRRRFLAASFERPANGLVKENRSLGGIEMGFAL